MEFQLMNSGAYAWFSDIEGVKKYTRTIGDYEL